jgi:2-polyprenyl-3-methyl-5-hydroxy-6-metoxy-1,4-benzoquinol methylase
MSKTRTSLRQIHNLTTSIVLEPQLRLEQRSRLPFVSERLIEFSTALQWIADRYPATLLDVGPGEGVWPRLLQAEGIDVVAIDEVGSYWKSYINRHYKVTRGDITRWCPPRRFECVTCISVLEHIPDHHAAMRNMVAALTETGELILTFPYNEDRYYPDVYSLDTASYGKDAGYITQQYSRRELDAWVRDTGTEILDLERWCVWTGEHWTEGERLTEPVRARPEEPHQLACVRLRRA